MVTAATTESRPVTRSAGSAVERKGWVLVALLCVVMILFGIMVLSTMPDLDDPIVGSGCCDGRVLSSLDPWAIDYLHEMARYMGSYMLGTGILGLAVTIFGLRRRQRWAWAVLWFVPANFAYHAFVLEAFPFDLITGLITVTGLLLMVRPVFGTPRLEH